MGREAVKTYIELGFGISILNEYLISKEDKEKFFIVNAAKFFGRSQRATLREGVVVMKPRFDQGEECRPLRGKGDITNKVPGT